MKKYSLFLLVLLWSCGDFNARKTKTINDGYSSTQEGKSTGSANVQEADEVPQELDVYLRRIAGVRVTGSGAQAVIAIRGVSTANSSIEPLFILNGNSITSFSQVHSMVVPRDIKSVTVLKDAGDTGIYGSRGANGVIIIKTK
jgi:TonB-dependent SusC/RagA subfamily outer membrane receptor